MNNSRPTDIVGVGIGPANLSAAALLEPVKEFTFRFFDSATRFAWHPGLLFPQASLQVSFLKDLVTLADPGSRYSFITFLFEQKRLYQFINAEFPRVSRMEFNQYLRWVADSLSNLEFGRSVDLIDYDHAGFKVTVGEEKIHASNIILGTGLRRIIPTWAQSHLGTSVWHGCEYLDRAPNLAGLSVAVIGGGQTGAEIFDHLLREDNNMPRRTFWISRRHNFLPLDESPFVNELFTPAFSEYFFSLGPEQRAHLLDEHKLASNGISQPLLLNIYRRLYELSYMRDGRDKFRLCAHQDVIGMERDDDCWKLACQDMLTGQVEMFRANVVILCTGFEYSLPACLAPIANRIQWEKDGIFVQQDFSVCWDGPSHLKIFVQNGARHKRGIADPNLSLIAWRSAVIVNSLAGSEIYKVRENDSLLDWALPKTLSLVAG